MAIFFLLFFVVSQIFKQSNCSLDRDQRSLCGSSTLQWVFVINLPTMSDGVENLENYLENIESVSFFGPGGVLPTRVKELRKKEEEHNICIIMCDEKDWENIYRYTKDRNIYKSHSTCCVEKRKDDFSSLFLRPASGSPKNNNNNKNNIIKYDKLDKLKLRTALKKLIKIQNKPEDLIGNRNANNNELINKYQNLGRILKTRSVTMWNKKSRGSQKSKIKKVTKNEKSQVTLKRNENSLKKKTNSKNRFTTKKNEKNNNSRKKSANISRNVSAGKKNSNKLASKKSFKKIHRRNAMIKNNNIHYESENMINEGRDQSFNEKLNHKRSQDKNNDNGSDGYSNLTDLKDKKNEKFQSKRDGSDDNFTIFDYGNSNSHPKTQDDSSFDIVECIFKVIEYLSNVGGNYKTMG